MQYRMVFAAVFLFSSPAYAADPLQMDNARMVMPVSHGISVVDRPTVNRCNAAIAQWAAKYNPIAVETRLAQPVSEDDAGARTAKLFVKVEYLRDGGIEPRSATIACTVSVDGRVSVSEV